MNSNKKIGILTFHASHNCGSMMQAYAMQNLLLELGYENEIIDFQNKGQRDMYAVIHKKLTVKNLLRNFVTMLHFKKISKQWDDYEKFMFKNFILSSKKYYETVDLETIDRYYSKCICGADQIWNITIPDSDDGYFLPKKYKNMKKIAYAPSFGSKNIKKYSDNPDKYKKFLENFDSLSIRENNGKKWINELTGKDVPVVLDPTLMIKKDMYDKISESANINEKYIFYYAPSYSRKLDKFVKKISKKYKLKVVVWNASEYYLKSEFINGYKLPKKFNPGVYYDLIKNAELVVTTSFHGTIFSTICKKKFWVLKNGGMYGDDDRVITLINQLKIADRLIEPNFDDNFDYFNDVNYSEYDVNLKKLQKQSLNYLINSLKK